MKFENTLPRFRLGMMITAIGLLAGPAQASQQQPALHAERCQLNSGWLERTPNFDALPSGWQTDGEVALIQTHLRLVIDQLQAADVSHLTIAQRERRAAQMETLRTYMRAVRFAQNIFVAGRRRVFIDPWGTHYAVGHLIAVSGHADLAQAINAEHRLDYLRDIRTAGLAQWQAESGLSVAELALIQPSYHYVELNYPTEIEELILGDSSAIKAAVEQDPSLVIARCGGKTLLHYAATAGDLELCQFLREKGADINAVTEAATTIDEGRRPQPPRMGVSSSSTIYHVQWNEPTKILHNGRGGIGRGGRILRSVRGNAIAGALADMRGGHAGKTPLQLATTGIMLRPLLPYGPQMQNESLVQLVKDRAAVAVWLQEQGAE